MLWLRKKAFRSSGKFHLPIILRYEKSAQILSSFQSSCAVENLRFLQLIRSWKSFLVVETEP